MPSSVFNELQTHVLARGVVVRRPPPLVACLDGGKSEVALAIASSSPCRPGGAGRRLRPSPFQPVRLLVNTSRLLMLGHVPSTPMHSRARRFGTTFVESILAATDSPGRARSWSPGSRHVTALPATKFTLVILRTPLAMLLNQRLAPAIKFIRCKGVARNAKSP